jgi:CRP-like cAMP-binding protein
LSGLELIFGVDRSPHEHLVVRSGKALSMRADRFQEVMKEREGFRALLLRSAFVAEIQTAETAISNATQPLHERLARWLLMYHDRTDGDEVRVTHNLLSTMLGVHRPKVTLVLQELEGDKLIKAQRATIKILNRTGLEELVGSAYGRAERELERLIPEAEEKALTRRHAS